MIAAGLSIVSEARSYLIVKSRYVLLVAVLLAALVAPLLGVNAQSTLVSDAPRSIDFPRDDGPHDEPIEWWYYTGHLFTENGDRYGFEFVVFKAQVGTVTGYASHFAITDNAAGSFQYDQRLGFAPADANVERETGFDLRADNWTMTGLGGNDQISAGMDGYAIDLQLTSEKEPVLHDGDGYIDYGDGEGSYYYSRTRMNVQGKLTVDGVAVPVTGESWFDHQWGDFSTFSRGGWDWYSFQFDDQTELMLYVVRDLDGSDAIVDGSYIAADGTLTVLEPEDFVLTPTGNWTSEKSGSTYPAGWTVDIPSIDLKIDITPTIADQELDTTASTGVIYWEGEVIVEGTKAGAPITGLGYVELTGYAPIVDIRASPES